MTRRVHHDFFIAAAALAIVIAVLAYTAVQVRAQSASDYTYRANVTITTGTTASPLTNTAVRLVVNATGLIDSGYLGSDGQDLLLECPSAEGRYLTAVEMGSSSADWWVPIVGTLEAGGTQNCTLYMADGATTATDNPQHLRLYGASDTIDVADHSSLDITTNLGIVATNLRFYATNTSAQYLLRKQDAYELGVMDTDDFYFRLVNSVGGATSAGSPNGAGFAVESWDNNVGCSANPDNYTCVDDPVGAPDDFTTYVQSLGATFTLDYYDLATPAGVNDPISQIDVVGRYLCTAGNTCRWAGGVRLGGIDVYGATQTTDVASTWETHTSTNVARPGGGIWTVSDLASLQLISRGRSLAPNFSHTQNYIVVHYNTATTLRYSTVAVDTDYASVAADFDGTTMSLLINGATVASGASGFTTIATNANDLQIGGATPLSTSFDRVQVSNGGTDQLDLQFEPAHMTGGTITGDVFEGTITDQSVNIHTAAYRFERTQTPFTAVIGPLAALSSSIAASSGETALEVTSAAIPGGSVDDPFGDSFDESGEFSFPMTLFTVHISDANFPPMLFATMVAIGLAISAWMGTFGLTRIVGLAHIVATVLFLATMALTPLPKVMMVLIPMLLIAILVLTPRRFERA